MGAYSLAVPSYIVYREYNDIPFLSSLTFRADDGWCDPSQDGIGVHCFGDFQDIYSKSALSPWDWVAPFSHPPLSHSVQWLFGQLTELTDRPLFALGAWLCLGFCALMLPAFWAARGGSPLFKASVVLVLGVGSVPVIATLDRGNSVFLLSAAFFAMAWSCWREKWTLAVTFSVLATMIRPQAILLCLVFLGLGRLKPFLTAGVLGVAGLLASFWIYPGDSLGNFRQWISNIVEYRDYASIYLHDGANLSLMRALILGLEIPGVNTGRLVFPGDSSEGAFFNIPLLGPAFQSGLVSSVVTLLGFGLIAATGFLMFARRARLSLPIALLLPALLVLVIPQTSYLYYASLLLTPIAFAIRLPPSSSDKLIYGLTVWRNRVLNGSIIGLALVSFVPIAIPLSLLVWQHSYVESNLSVHLIGPFAVWTLLVSLALLLLPEVLPSRKTPTS